MRACAAFACRLCVRARECAGAYAMLVRMPGGRAVMSVGASVRLLSYMLAQTTHMLAGTEYTGAALDALRFFLPVSARSVVLAIV